MQELREENTALRKELADARQDPISLSPFPLSPTFHLSSAVKEGPILFPCSQICRCLLKCIFVRILPVLTRRECFYFFPQISQWAAASWGSFRELYREESTFAEVTNHSTWEAGVWNTPADVATWCTVVYTYIGIVAVPSCQQSDRSAAGTSEYAGFIPT